MSAAIHGLYAITDSERHQGAALEANVAAVLRGGARVIQYRDKSADHPRRRREARTLLGQCREAGALFVVNDDVELAAAVAAPAVHLGGDDAPVTAARSRLGPEVILGASCYDSLQRADSLRAAGADYLAFGRVFDSPTKPDSRAVPWQTLREAIQRYPCPVVAIGGITAANAEPLVALGVDAVAVISGVFAAADPEAAAARIAALFRSD